jgi:hypothetical protein
MNVDPENFASLQKLLALKRLEQPPPGYFDGLADKITWRLETGEGRSSFWDLLAATFSHRPVLAYGIVLTLCGTIAGGTIYSLRTDGSASSDVASVESWDPVTPALAVQVNPPRVLHALSWSVRTDIMDDAPVVPAHSLFQPVKMVAIPAAYNGGN